MIAGLLAVIVLVVAVGYWQRICEVLDYLSPERQREREARFLAEQKLIAQQWTRERRHG